MSFVVDLDEAYRKYRPIVSGRIGNELRSASPEDREDLVGKVFLSVIETVKGGKWRGEADIGTLIFRITKCRVADYLRQKYSQGLEINREVAIFDPALTEIEQRQFMTAVIAAMDRLTDRQREVFSLCGLEGLTAPEAAVRLGLSKGRVQKAYARGREIVTKAVNEWQAMEVDPETLVGWMERLWMAYLRLGIRTRRLDVKNEQFARKAKDEIIRRLMEG